MIDIPSMRDLNPILNSYKFTNYTRVILQPYFIIYIDLD